MVNKTVALIASIGLILTLGACGGSAEHQNRPDQKQTTSKILRSKRGNIVKHAGEEAGITGSSGKDVADWTVANITIDAKCTNPEAGQPEHGHYVVLDISAKTTAEFDPQKYGSLSLGEPYMWQYIEKNGTQWNGMPGSSPAASCLTDTENLPHAINQGVKAKGKVVFDLPSTDGTLVYTQQGSDGWEYPLK